MTQQPLDLIIEFPEGAGELIVDPTHPAVAGFRRGLIEGQRTGAWRYLIVHDQPRLLPIIIGTFVKTPKSRVLFFQELILQYKPTIQQHDSTENSLIILRLILPRSQFWLLI